ncbi:MAG TPA: ATP-binding cassette domain-containing protein, partial [Mycobacteriales bacterium]|nr:ATP-binding cassette domain-containing protein [Mycobacteriales bacterium]
HGDERVAGELGPSDRKTVALARALAGRPSLLLLDEPAAGLDRDERRDLVERIQSIRDGGTTVVLVDHDIELVLEVCDRVVVLDLGAVVYDGPPAGARTDDRVAAAYLGGAHTHAPEIERDRRFEPAGVPALVRARDVSLAYGDTTVVRNLDFDVRAGERVALLGPNGAGKTTTLLALSGALPTVRGRLEVLGTTKRRAHLLARRGVANVLQDHKVFTSLSAADNLRLAGADRRRREQLREQFPALKRVWNRPAGTLSGGEQQLLALARAVARSPELLLIDELSLGLAPVTVVELFKALADWQVESGCAIVFAEQHVEHALDFADRAYVLNAGRVVLEAAAAELRRRPDLVASAYLGRPDTPESRHDGD